jgi:hypothetical protein
MNDRDSTATYDVCQGEIMPAESYLYRVGGIAAIVGIVIVLFATLAHPMGEDPADAPAAFAEYAADRYWMVSHLGSLSVSS